MVTDAHSSGEDRAWQAVKNALPREARVYKPRTLPAAFSSIEVVEACVAEDSSPRYTVVYRDQGGSIALILNQGFGSWGNTPGPATRMDQVQVRGHVATLTYVSGTINGQNLDFHDASWQENGAHYEVKATNSGLTESDLLQVVDSMVEVK